MASQEENEAVKILASALAKSVLASLVTGIVFGAFAGIKLGFLSGLLLFAFFILYGLYQIKIRQRKK